MDYYDWRQDLPPSVADKIDDWFSNRPEADDCMDGQRVARVGDGEASKRYDEIRGAGCCGSVDEEIMIEGVRYQVGFNYGH